MNSPKALALGWLSFEQRSYLTKSVEWAYEEEERVLKQNVATMTFLESELVSIIVGPRFTEENLRRLRAVTQKRTRPLKIFRAQMSRTSYSIEVEWENEL
jgi:hypothetical protein